MSLIIKGMEMPPSCWRCKLKVGFCACGLVTDHKDGGLFYRVHNGNSRPDWCPLVPLPEKHGRLIDADRLLRDNPELADCDFIHPKYDTTLRELIDEAPTIIEAEGGGEDG